MRLLQGTVVSDKMNKTRVVAVYRMKKHSRYQKYFRVTTRHKVHDEKNLTHIGDVVSIREVRPLSRDKRFVVESVVTKAAKVVTEER